MPNDLGQPLNGMIRNNCRLEYDIHRKTPRVEALRLTLAEKLLKTGIKASSEPVKFTK